MKTKTRRYAARHRSMQETCKCAPLAIRFNVATKPRRRSAIVCRKQCVFCCMSVDYFCQIGSRYSAVVTRYSFCLFRLSGFGVPRHIFIAERGIAAVSELREQRFQRCPHIADNPLRDWMPSTKMRWIDIDLHYCCLAGVELSPGKVRTQQQERVAVQQSVITGLIAEYPGHPDVVRIVKLKEIFSAR